MALGWAFTKQAAAEPGLQPSLAGWCMRHCFRVTIILR